MTFIMTFKNSQRSRLGLTFLVKGDLKRHQRMVLLTVGFFSVTLSLAVTNLFMSLKMPSYLSY